MNSYEEKQEARRDRYEAQASKADGQSASLYRLAKERASFIPFGQPILVGHHSEGRDRNNRARIERGFRQSFALSDKANYYRSKAANVGSGGISADDPDAITKLRAELDSAKRSQDMMKGANACIRRNDREGLAGLGFKPEQIEELFKPDFARRVGFPSYALTNNNANMRRIAARIAELEAARERETKIIEGSGYQYQENSEENRVMFIFPGKPDEKVRALLKSYAFKWSPSRGAWVRQLSANGIYAGKQVQKALAAV